jgi:hypothetical protein
MRLFLSVSIGLLAACAAACSSNPPGSTFDVHDRAPGERAPRTAACDDMDPTSCLLPWPSSVFTALDSKSPTGVRLAVAASSVDSGDDPASLNRADGFSRMTPILTGFASALDAPAPDAVQLFLVQPDLPGSGEAVPLRVEVKESTDDPGNSLVVATPRKALAEGAEYLVVVTDALHAKGGGALTAERAAKVALGLEAPASQADADLFGYHAPARAVLQKAGVDPQHVLRLWDFTTRSAGDATRRLTAMREAAVAAVKAGKTAVLIDSVTSGSGGNVDVVVEGRLSGLPSFVAGAGLTLDDSGMPVASGTREAPFRVEIPKGTGDYPFLMFGHGTGGSFHDSAFDAELAQKGIAKVGFSFYGWTDKDVLDTFLGLAHMFSGTEKSTAFLMQAVADGAAIQAAMTGPIGKVLSAATLGDKLNPVATRHPNGSVPLWAGGSLGGTMGLVFASAEPEMKAAVLNVPGGGWTHFIPGSTIYAQVAALLKAGYGDDLALLQALLMSQSNWDDVDGALWGEALAGRDAVFLIQESIGDPVLPNVGTENVTLATGAVQVGAVLAPIPGVVKANGPVGQSALTQYHVPDKAPLDIHGFAAKDTPAGTAARAQIQSFVESVLAGKPQIDVPAGCVGGSCDFTK